MKILILGAAGFIGTNITKKLIKDNSNQLILVDCKKEFFSSLTVEEKESVKIIEDPLLIDTNFKKLLDGIDIVYHLVSTTVPSTSNQHIPQELTMNVVFTANLLEACKDAKVQRVVFISSGGTVYGKDAVCPIQEDMQTNPITSYGVQKVTIERLLYLYKYMYGLDYCIIRLANPYGPYQRINGILGAVTNFTYRALTNEKIIVYGNGTVVRDYIYIDNAIDAIINIASNKKSHDTYNIGCGYGTSINQLLSKISNTLGVKLDVEYRKSRKVDVPINYLDVSRYEVDYGEFNAISLNEGIKKTAEFLKMFYHI